ncbi:MAG: hypothetical protein FJY17_03120 [Bacteroidetes bacterium]|nr:hypothetical protein [Bacteroidota bacterium]
MKYLNGVLTVIAVCLILITFAITGVIQKVNAGNTNPHYVSVPVNPDGSINVKFVKGDVMDVNIEEVGGWDTWGTVKVDIAKVDGSSTDNPLPVKIER